MLDQLLLFIKSRRNTFVMCLGMLFPLLFWSAGNPVVNSNDIILKVEKLPFNVSSFYVADVKDDRAEKKAIASLVSLASAGTPAAGISRVDLKGGTIGGLKQFIAGSIPTDKKLHAIVVHLNELKVTETAGAQGQVDGIVAISMSFYLKRNGEEVHLLDYQGGAKYGRSIKQQGVVEPVLRQTLVGTLKYFNTWMEEQVLVNEKLAKRIKVTFSEPKLTARDTVFYKTNRPLTWSDFKGKPNGKSTYAASVFPGFGYKGNTKVIDGVIHLNLAMHVFMVQEWSWVKDVARNPYSLNHEQKHFDIVKVVAEKFKKRLHPDSLTVEDYNSIIQYKYIESYREMNRLQEQYDAETRHGIDKERQAYWDKRIADELKRLGVN